MKVGYVIIDPASGELWRMKIYKTLGHARAALTSTFEIKGYAWRGKERTYEEWDFRDNYLILPACVEYEHD